MIRIRHVTILITLLLVIGCSTIHTNLIDPTGRILPDPSYTLQVIGNPLYITFYYAAHKDVKDVDGTHIFNPVYLDFLKFHDINRNEFKGITLTIEVNNPTGLEYSLYEKITMKTGGNVNWIEVQKGGEVNRSNLPYRQFVYKLPYGKNFRIVDHLVTINLGNQKDIARIGNFRYTLK